MIDCNHLIHPFQHDPGVSQRQRVMEDLLSGSAEIDGRSLADLLDYFMQLSRHINFYETDLSVSDWQPFFQKSLPFTVAAITKFDAESVDEKLAFYHQLFKKNPSSSGLQLLVHFIYFRLINPLNSWQLQINGSELPVAFALEKLNKDKLQLPVKAFIKYANAAVQWCCIKPVDWQRLHQNEVWNLYPSDLYESDVSFKSGGATRREWTTALYDAILNLAPAFLDVMRLIADAAALSMDQSLIPLKDELREKHQPHLALLFAFLKLFRHLQDDLNGFTKKHLDFFYKQVLQLKPREATPDKAHIVFEIQNQLDSYLLQEGLQLKDGKDDNKAEVFFALDDEIVVNKAQVADKRTLFLNNQTYDKTYVEGVYMGPDAGKADGVEKDFKENGLNSFSTLGAKYSKYSDPEHGFVKLYPNARLGFILASPVLLLNEGKRTVEITLACELKENICGEIKISAGASSSCCEDNSEENGETFIDYPSFTPSSELYDEVEKLLDRTYYYISQDLIAQAGKKGISAKITDTLTGFLTTKKKICYCETDEIRYNAIVPATDTDGAGFEDVFTAGERDMLADFFGPRKAINVLFSGEKEWIKASAPVDIKLVPDSLSGSTEFALTITATLEADKPAVTFYDKDQLKEDFKTTLPLVKIELDDKIKIELPSDDDETEEENDDSDEKKCCLEKDPSADEPDVSLYHFFRNVLVIDKVEVEEEEDEETKVYETGIAVKVCGLKNFIVQNDESIQDVNSPIYPFGTRPAVADFDAVNPAEPPLENPNLVGPNFYVGSKEIFLKKWEQICFNLNWKNKPTNFNDYYKGYLVRRNFHNCEDREDNTLEIFGLNECDFEVNVALLENGGWLKELTSTKVRFNDITEDWNRELFIEGSCNEVCTQEEPFEYSFFVENTDFDGTRTFGDLQTELTEYRKDSREGFLRLNLQNQDFLHKDYSFVLARQMMAFGRYPDLIDGAVYIEGGVPKVFDISIFFGNIGPKVIEIAEDIVNSAIDDILDELIQIISDKIDESTNPALLEAIIERCKTLLDDLIDIASISVGNLFSGPFDISTLSAAEQDQVNTLVKNFAEDLFDLLETNLAGIEDDLKAIIRDKFSDLLDDIDTDTIFSGFFDDDDKEVIIPNEPWTPIISEISIDYSATAEITDIDLIHLYPYEGTYKPEELELQPTLLPTFCDEGTLFLGLKDLVPGSNINMLFQLAEATADSESERQDLHWFYLDNNQWKLLREGFEVLDDATDGLTSSGIIKFTLPANMTSDNTILPKGLHWIKAAISQNSRSASETIGIHTQAVQVTFTNEEANDKMRLGEALPAGSIAKMKEADASVKKVNQPYDGFGGRLPEASGHFYVRTSELMRHKGRSIQKFDYERLALEAFPQLFKIKCINHSFGLDANRYFNDFPVAPGYVLLAVIPDLNQLKAVASFDPRAPVSLLGKVRDYLRQRTSPFVRLKIMNPRYENVHFCLKVKLYLGRDENFYKAKLMQDLREFLAPWAVGQYDKLTFGQCIFRSDIVRFLESRNYLDYLLELRMIHENGNGSPIDQQKVCPLTPRSILIAGDIDVCIQQQDCETWQKCYEINEQEEDCCDHEKIPLADYCDEPVIE